MTDPGLKQAPRVVRIAVAALLAGFAALAVTSARRTSATWDEPRYLGLGHYLVTGGGFDLPSITTTPPLTFYLNSLLLPFADVDDRCFVKGPAADILAGVTRGQCLLRSSRPSGDDLLFLARLPFIGVGVLLGLLVFRWSRRLFGDAGGLLSLALYVTCPNILAATRLINQDTTLSALGLATVYACWEGRERGWSWSLAIAVGGLLGLTLGAKYPGLLWVPMVAGLWAMRFPRAGAEPHERPAGRSVVQPLLIFATALAILLILYRFDARAYVDGLGAQRSAIGGAFPAFLNGVVSRDGGWWSYYLQAAAIKTPLPALALYALGVVVTLMKMSEDRVRPLFFLAPPLVLLLAFSAYREVNAGLRYILPAYPFLMVMAGGVPGAVGRRGRLAVIALLAWCGLETASIHPHYLAYFNQSVGGPGQGYRHLMDGNLGWGGDLGELAAFAKRNHIARLKLSYHGTAVPELYGLDYEPLPSFVLPRPPSSPLRVAEGEWVAVSVENLAGLFIDLGEFGRFLKAQQPDAVIGYSIFVYHLTDLRARMEAFAAEEAKRAPSAGR